MAQFRDFLITDRSSADVERVRYLASLWGPAAGQWRGTAAERSEWESGLKGAYNASDLNRVTLAASYLLTKLGKLGYAVPDTFPAYMASAVVDPPGSGTAKGALFYKGDEVTVSAEPIGEYEFISWKENGLVVSTDPFYKFKGEMDRTLSANFEILQYIAGRDWWEATLPNGTSFASLTYGDGKFVAIPTYGDGKFAYSTDGISWKETVSLHLSSDITWRDIAYGDGKFVAIPAFGDGKFAYSTDGVNWKEADFPYSQPDITWETVAYGNGKFVAVSSVLRKAAYSTDGIHWILNPLPFDSGLTGLTYGDGKFVAALTGVGKSKRAAYSTDGIHWSETNLPSEELWRNFVYGNGKFVAVSFNNHAAYSIDGINWEATVMPLDEMWGALAYGGGRFIALGYPYSKNAAYSKDGINWILATLPLSSTWGKAAYGNGRFVAVESGNKVAYSYNG